MKNCDIKKVIYVDNNGTTLISDKAKNTYIEWLSCYNPSTDSKISKSASKIIEKSSDYILNLCNTSTADYTVIYTSGASESNCLAIRSCVKAFKNKLEEYDTDILPHVIVSSLEHNATMSCIKDLVDTGMIEVSYIKPSKYGNILSKDVEKEIKDSTCLVSIMSANNEIPVINNIKKISDICHKYSKPLHTDAVQVFGKYKIDLVKNGIDMLSASSHKFYGPKGVGLLILSNKLIKGYNLKAEINGSQQYNLRGGTENVPAIASTMVALKDVHNKRDEKNKKLLRLREYFLKEVSKIIPMEKYETYLEDIEHKNLELVSLGPPDNKREFILPNTILIAVCKNKGKPFCNVNLKKYLDSKGIIVSIGSACNTNKKKSSHVLDSIGAPSVIKRGVIRISFGDKNTLKEVKILVKEFINGIYKQCTDIKNELE